MINWRNAHQALDPHARLVMATTAARPGRAAERPPSEAPRPILTWMNNRCFLPFARMLGDGLAIFGRSMLDHIEISTASAPCWIAAAQ